MASPVVRKSTLSRISREPLGQPICQIGWLRDSPLESGQSLFSCLWCHMMSLGCQIDWLSHCSRSSTWSVLLPIASHNDGVPGVLFGKLYFGGYNFSELPGTPGVPWWLQVGNGVLVPGSWLVPGDPDQYQVLAQDCTGPTMRSTYPILRRFRLVDRDRYLVQSYI
jgi:hypothetical protein